MSSFSAHRKGCSRPSNIPFKRRRSDEKSMPSPSFNSSMSLGKIEDVFVDSTRAVNRLRYHYSSMPATPSSLLGGSSPVPRMERLPSLAELFDRDILSPQSSRSFSLESMRFEWNGEAMRRSSSAASASSGRSRLWMSTFHQDGQAFCIRSPATPPPPFFTRATSKPYVSPKNVSPDASAYDDGNDDVTPRAPSNPCFDCPETSKLAISPKCPGAPLIGVLGRSHLRDEPWPQGYRAGSLGPFEGEADERSQDGLKLLCLSAEDLVKDRAAMARLESEMPKCTGLTGLGIYMDEDNVRSPFRRAAEIASGCIEGAATSPSGPADVGEQHTGLTPMVKAAKIFETSATPTRPKAKTPPSSRRPQSSNKLTEATPSKVATAKKHEAVTTPLAKSRPIFRFDTGSGKKHCKPKGHKMSPNSSPWGVFGAKDGWKPLAAPNVSRALADANKVVAEIKVAASAPSSPSLKSSPINKRHVQSIMTASSPSKRTRTMESPASSSPCKENIDALLPTMSPSMRAYTRSKAHRDAPTALPLHTVR